MHYTAGRREDKTQFCIKYFPFINQSRDILGNHMQMKDNKKWKHQFKILITLAWSRSIYSK